MAAHVPFPPQFKTPTDFIGYVVEIERRIIQLELEKENLLRKVTELNSLIELQNNKIGELQNRLPNTSILSNSFTTRAFAIWGHMLVVQFILGVIGLVIMMIFAVLGSMVEM